MKKRLRLVPVALLFLFSSSWIFAQQGAQQPEYFSLQHLSPEQMDPADAALLKKEQRRVQEAAEFYGFDFQMGPWTQEQAVCPLIPDYLLMHYTRKDASGAESVFTALVPRQKGRVRIVPVLDHGVTRFKPAPQDPRNFQLFSEVVPHEVARKNSHEDGQWLLLSVCYAEMTGNSLQVLKNPGVDLRLISAIPPTLRVSVGGDQQQVLFTGPLWNTGYWLWNITYNSDGHIIAASSEQHSYSEPSILHPSEPQGRPIPNLPAPQPRPMPK
ncbi:hypothetical protein [Pseudacidobacterium ailaaui]|jgi:hypothetical protein|uniref:hypothetical protein n=1 Tax=Pseudacidobacterium ailaaui TaxID=1382359 RepID=UPI00047C07CC|nr:hypothetical protein [Pseudacidobacterium ailaaui]